LFLSENIVLVGFYIIVLPFVFVFGLFHQTDILYLFFNFCCICFKFSANFGMYYLT